MKCSQSDQYIPAADQRRLSVIVPRMMLVFYRSGGRKKTEAIKTARALYPGLAGYVVSRFARSQGWLDGEQESKRKDDRRPWTREEEQELFVRAGYEPVKAIAQKLKRSEQSVRFRLKGRAISARVTDGWSLRRIQQTLHISQSPAAAFDR